MKDSFEAVNRIQDIPSSLFVNGYKFASFDVKSLFTNVPIKKTIGVILTQIYNDHTISTNLKKRSLKKLILDTCNKTAFSFSKISYEQKDGVSMGSSFWSVMAIIIIVIKPHSNDGTIKFYSRYVDDALLVVKPQDVSRIHKLLNGFDKNLKFTVDLLKMKFPIFSTWKCYRMESRFMVRTLTLGYMCIIQVLYLLLTVPYGLEA